MDINGKQFLDCTVREIVEHMRDQHAQLAFVEFPVGLYGVPLAVAFGAFAVAERLRNFSEAETLAPGVVGTTRKATPVRRAER